MSKKRKIIALVLNLLLILTLLRGLYLGFFERAHPPHHYLKYYTQDSNVFLLVATTYYFISLLINVIFDKKISKLAHIAKFSATAAVSQTFFVVALVFTPVLKDFSMYTGGGFYLHFLCPVLGIIIFLFFEDGYRIRFRDIALGYSFTIVYACVLLPLCIFELTAPPYPFLDVHNHAWYIIIIEGIGVLGLAYLWLLLLKFVYNRKYKKKKNYS